MPRPAMVLLACALASTVLAGMVIARADAQDAGVARVEVRWERPPEGTLDRGIFGVPSWTVIGVGGVAIAAAALGLVASARRARSRGAR